MALFVHITSDTHIASFRRGGIKVSEYTHDAPPSVFAVPVTPNFVMTHQWLREMRRSGQRTMCAVYFRIPDDEIVYSGRYNQPRRQRTAAQTVAWWLKAKDTAGFEVLIPRKIDKREIVRVRHLRQVIGWRYSPESHTRFFCGCIVCVPPGTIRSRQKNRAWEEKQRRQYRNEAAEEEPEIDDVLTEEG
jgi:hypothetical protein